MPNEEETKKKPIYKKWWFWVIILVIIAAIAGGTQNENTNSASTSPTSIGETSTEEKQNEEKTEYNQGEEAILGNGAVTVTNVEKSQGNDWDKPKSGKEYVIVYVTIENKGDSNLSYNPLYFKIQNSQGQQENMTFTTIDQDTALQSGELVPGGKVSGTITFEQPKGDKNLVLIYNDNLWSSKELKIKLQ